MWILCKATISKRMEIPSKNGTPCTRPRLQCGCTGTAFVAPLALPIIQCAKLDLEQASLVSYLYPEAGRLTLPGHCELFDIL